MRYILACISFCIFSICAAQSKNIKVLFIGNSYTHYNDLPKILSTMASSTGDSIYVESSTPGGHSFAEHTKNKTTSKKIKKGDWDYVILQEHSQNPSAPMDYVEKCVFPSANKLHSRIKRFNPHAKVVFYMTWGRQNGDSTRCKTWPAVCSYQGMDSLTNLRYHILAEKYAAMLSPVGEVWNYLRRNYPDINLYSPDGSHPSLAGSYAAACCFYCVLLNKDPMQIKYSPLSSFETEAIQKAVRLVVFDAQSKK